MKESKIEVVVRGVRVPRFYRGKWQDGKRHYRFKDELENPVSIMRDLLKRSGIYKLPNFDEQQADKILGQLYLYSEKKITGIAVEKGFLLE